MTALCPQSGKVRYATRLDAQDARSQRRKQSRRDVARGRTPETLYQCVHCAGWHLSKMERLPGAKFTKPRPRPTEGQD